MNDSRRRDDEWEEESGTDPISRLGNSRAIAKIQIYIYLKRTTRISLSNDE